MSNWEKDRYFPDPPDSILTVIGRVALGLLMLIGGGVGGALSLVFWGALFAAMFGCIFFGILLMEKIAGFVF